MKIITCEQHDAEWVKARLGIPTASAFSKIVTGKGEPSKQADDYMRQLAAERITRRMEPTHKSAAMEEGTAREAASRRIYSMDHEVEVEQVGFCLSDCERYGCSPDGLVGDDGLVEFKNPMGKTLIKYMLKGGLPADYFQQVQGQLFVTGREWCDFVVYYPGLWRFEVRVLPDTEFLGKLGSGLDLFCDRLDDMVEKLHISYGGRELVPAMPEEEQHV